MAKKKIWWVCSECGVPFQDYDVNKDTFMECNCGEQCVRINDLIDAYFVPTVAQQRVNGAPSAQDKVKEDKSRPKLPDFKDVYVEAIFDCGDNIRESHAKIVYDIIKKLGNFR